MKAWGAAITHVWDQSGAVWQCVGQDVRSVSSQTIPGVVKKKDQVIAKVATPISEPTADRIGLNAPATSSAAIPNSATPRTYASPRRPNTDNHEINGLLLMN